MRSVKDSFELELEPFSETAREGAVVREKKAKTTIRRNSIPEGVSTGFKKASELLRATEASKLSFDAGVHSLHGLNLEEEAQQGNGDTKSKKKASVPRPRRKKDVIKSVESTAHGQSVYTSHHFPQNGQADSRVQQIDNVSNRKPRGKQTVEIEDGIMHENPPAHNVNTKDSLQSAGTTEHGKSVPNTRANDQTSDFNVRNSVMTNENIIPPAGQNTKAYGDDHSKDHRQHGESSSSTVLTAMKSPEKGRTIDLTVEPDSSIAEDGADRMTNIVAKYTYHARDPQVETSKAAIISNAEPIPQISKDSIPSLTRPVLKQRASPIKKKSPAKKKALTVTEKALVDFRTEEVGDSIPLPEYFLPIVSTKPLDEAGNTAKAKPRARATRRTRTVQKKSSLVTPSDALRSLHDQHLVFGTSSQLLQHSSSPVYEHNSEDKDQNVAAPTLGRNDSFVDIDSLLRASPGLLVLKSTRSLWSAAHRDDDGSLIEAGLVEPIEIEDNSVVIQEPLGATVNVLDDSETYAHNPDLDETILPITLAQDPVAEKIITLPLPTIDAAIEQVPTLTKAIPTLARSLGEAATRERERTKSPVKKKRKVKASNDKPEDPFKKVPLEDLKAELRGYGCKLPRSRAKMGELILECRAKQNGLQSTENVQHQPMPDQLLPTDMPPAALQGIDLPAALETNTVKSSPAKRKRAQVKPASSGSDDLPPPSFQVPTGHHNQQDQAHVDELLAGINRAVKAQPSIHSIQHPSWQEKIAMYDTIVLEDFTAWLNGGGLDAVGVDAEVWPGLVRDWCESKSVCFISATGGWRKKRQK